MEKARKAIYVDINSCARTICVGVRQWNATQRMPTSVATEAVCYVRIYARQVEISWTGRKERGCREVSNVPKKKKKKEDGGALVHHLRPTVINATGN